MRRKNANTSTGSVDPENDAGETFLGRWSRRKQRARSDEDDSTSVDPPEAHAPDVPGDQAGPPERVLTDEDMPPLDTLDADSDYKGFLSPGVSETLRNAALRKLFLSPKFNFVDGLDDYADDFTKFEALGDIITADMRHQMEVAEERAKKTLEEDLASSTDEATAPAGDDEAVVENDDDGTLTASTDDETDVDSEEAENEIPDDPSSDETRHG